MKFILVAIKKIDFCSFEILNEAFAFNNHYCNRHLHSHMLLQNSYLFFGCWKTEFFEADFFYNWMTLFLKKFAKIKTNCQKIFKLLTLLQFFKLTFFCVNTVLLCLTRRRHDMGNSLGDEISCGSSTPLTYSTLNVLAPNGQWVLRKTPLKFYTQLICF